MFADVVISLTSTMSYPGFEFTSRKASGFEVVSTRGLM
jgi:hypothetical protein